MRPSAAGAGSSPAPAWSPRSCWVSASARSRRAGSAAPTPGRLSPSGSSSPGSRRSPSRVGCSRWRSSPSWPRCSSRSRPHDRRPVRGLPAPGALARASPSSPRPSLVLLLSRGSAPLMGAGLLGSPLGAAAAPRHRRRRRRGAGGALVRRYHLARLAVGAAGLAASSGAGRWRSIRYSSRPISRSRRRGARRHAARWSLIALGLGARGPAAVSGLSVPRLQGRAVHSPADCPEERPRVMMRDPVHTERLELTPLDARRHRGPARRRRRRASATLTGALFPSPRRRRPTWPSRCPVVRERLRAQPDEAPWWNWLIVRAGDRRAVGSVAFGGPPDDGGSGADRLRDVRAARGPRLRHRGGAGDDRVGLRAARGAAGPRAGAGVEHAGAARGRERRACARSRPTRTTTWARCWSTPSALQHPSDRPDQQRQHQRGPERRSRSRG